MTVLYEKRGRRYVPVSDYELRERDLMPLGTFRLTYCYSEGGRRYRYDVTPDTASFTAAAEIAQHAMELAINDAAKAFPQMPIAVPYTKKQLALIETFKHDAAALGMLVPAWWQHSSTRDIAQAGVEAVRNYRP